MLVTVARGVRASTLLLAFAFAPGPGTYADEIAWIHDPARALSQAVEFDRPILVDVWAIWCVPCKKMDETAYRDPRVVQAMTAFIPLKVDHDAQETFVERHEVEALPALLFLDGRGREIARLTGLIDATLLATQMERVRAGYAGYLQSRDQEADPAAVDRLAQYFREVGNSRAAVEVLRRKLKHKQPIPAELRDTMRLHLALAQSTIGETKGAIAQLESLVQDSAVPQIQAEALVGLVLIHRKTGAIDDAQAALSRLRQEFPDVAAKEIAAE